MTLLLGACHLHSYFEKPRRVPWEVPFHPKSSQLKHWFLETPCPKSYMWDCVVSHSPSSPLARAGIDAAAESASQFKLLIQPKSEMSISGEPFLLRLFSWPRSTPIQLIVSSPQSVPAHGARRSGARLSKGKGRSPRPAAAAAAELRGIVRPRVRTPARVARRGDHSAAARSPSKRCRWREVCPFPVLGVRVRLDPSYPIRVANSIQRYQHQIKQTISTVWI